MPCNNSGWDRNIPGPGSRPYFVPTNYSLEEFCRQGSRPDTDDFPPIIMDSANPPSWIPEDGETARIDKSHHSRFRAYPATVYPKADFTTQKLSNGATATTITSDPPLEAGHTFVITESNPYGEHIGHKVHVRNWDKIEQRSDWGLMGNVEIEREVLSQSQDASHQEELHILLNPQEVDNTGCNNENIMVHKCPAVIKVHLSERVPLPDDWCDMVASRNLCPPSIPR